jgi:carboxymethylenebutenolidase
MCDQDTPEIWQEYIEKAATMNRRRFGALTAAGAAGAAAALMLPGVANAADVTESDVAIKTPDGTADCYFVHPASGAAPGVLIWPDILGLRPAFRTMGKRLAEAGYAVLVVNPFYRGAKAPVVPEGAGFSDPAVRDKVMPLARALNPTTHVTDAKAFTAWLDAQDAVDKTKKLATTGYCMGGPIVFRTAATRADRIGAACTFHGAGLATDSPDSPHLLIPQMKANFLVCIAESDDKQTPNAKTLLKEGFQKAGLTAEVEVYEGTAHGWCPIDSAVYNMAQAEKAWSRMLAHFKTALA